MPRARTTKTTSKKTTTKKTTAVRRTKARAAAMPAELRHQMIREAAYLKAEAYGFTSDPQADWLAAEAEVDARLGNQA